MDETIDTGAITPGEIPTTPNTTTGTTNRIDQTATAAAPDVTVVPGDTTDQGRSFVPDMRDIANAAVQVNTISDKGEVFIQQIKRLCADYGLTVKELNYPPKTLVASYEDRFIILLNDEAIGASDKIPTISKLEIAAKYAQDELGGKSYLINGIVVSPEDYDRYVIMSAYLRNALVMTSPTSTSSRFTVQSLNDYVLEVAVGNSTKYSHSLVTTNPHGIPARADVYITITATSIRNNVGERNMFTDAASQSSYELASVGAYTIFNRPNVGGKLIPEVHISEITTSFQNERILPIVLAIAKTVLLDHGAWRSQFMTIGKNTANIGNLVMDQTHKPMQLDSSDLVNDFINAYTTNPILCLDIVEGRARVPGLERYGLTDWAPYLTQVFNSVFRVQPNEPNIFNEQFTIGVPFYSTYGGVCMLPSSQAVDLRWADYLNLMIHNYNDYSKCERLLYHSSREIDTAQYIADIVRNIRLNYRISSVLISTDAISALCQLVGSRIRVNYGGNLQTSGIIDTSSLVNYGNGYISRTNGFSPYDNAYSSFSNIWAPQNAGMQGFPMGVGSGNSGNPF